MSIWDDVGFVCASKYRVKVLQIISIHPTTPSAIANEIGIRLVHVSRTLNELESKGIVKCLTPHRLRGRIYGLTAKGLEVAQKINKRIH
jgi:DNA-binding MarR family transcriptional regulator